MSKFVDRPRYGCALGGALATLRAIPRAIPIIHASAGCGGNLYNSMNAGAGYLGGGYCGGSALPSTNVVERDVVFGGEERLREQIGSTLEIIDGDLFVVVTGCMVDMIGDDVHSVVSEFKHSDKPVLGVSTPSFRGNAFTGYELVMKTIIRNYVRKQDARDALTVNVLGIVPAQDVFWKGNLREIKRLLEGLGLTVNTFFGEGETLENIRDSAKAGLNIVVSDIFGIDSAAEFEEVHGVPYITTPFPIGAIAGERFLREVAAALSLDVLKAELLIGAEKKVYYDYLERISDIYNDIDLQRYAIVVGDSNYAPALTRFVSDELGWLPELAVVTDFVDEKQKETVGSRFKNLDSGLEVAVRFDTDASSVKKHLSTIWPRNRNDRYYDSFGPAVVLGSAFERDIASEFGYPIIPVTYPLTNRCVMGRAYAGFTGGLSLVEDIISYLVAGR